MASITGSNCLEPRKPVRASGRITLIGCRVLPWKVRRHEHMRRSAEIHFGLLSQCSSLCCTPQIRIVSMSCGSHRDNQYRGHATCQLRRSTDQNRKAGPFGTNRTRDRRPLGEPSLHTLVSEKLDHSRSRVSSLLHQFFANYCGLIARESRNP